MDFPLLPLAFNLALLGMALFICRTLNASQASLRWNGALIFLVLCIAALGPFVFSARHGRGAAPTPEAAPQPSS
mgnify:CR=1 FL=1